MDLYSRKIVGYKISTNASTQLATSTFRKAFKDRGCPAGLMFHSDNGGQYTSRAFRSLLVNCDVDQSFSRPHTPIDNAVAESFFANLKREEVYRHEYRSEREFRDRIDKYINNYNSSRPHRHNNYKYGTYFTDQFFSAIFRSERNIPYIWVHVSSRAKDSKFIIICPNLSWNK